MKTSIALPVTVVHFLLLLFGVCHHELWLDEAQHILLARESSTLHSLLQAARYEGHPLLWNMLLFIATRFTDSNFMLQCFHAGLASASVLLILRYAPFRWYVSLAIVFGYFLFYEYSVICRNYAISVLLLLLLLRELSRGKKNFSVLALLFALFINTHLFSLFLAFGLLIHCSPELLRQRLRTQIGFALIFLPALLFCLWHLQPPSDHFLYSYNKHPLLSSERLRNVAHLPLLGLLPLPDLSVPNYWSNHPLVSLLPFQLLGGILLALPLWLFGKTRLLMFSYLVPLLLIIAFVYLSPLHLATRHCGFLSLLLLATLWLRKGEREVSDSVTVISGTKRTIMRLYVGLLLVVQLLSGILFFILDVQRGFSSGKKTAAWLENNVSDRTTVVVSHFTSGPAIRVFTQMPLYYLESGEDGSYAKWNTQPLFLSDSLIVQRIDTLLSKKPKLIFITNTPDRVRELATKDKLTNFKTKVIASFTGATIQSENYYIYLLTKN